MVRFVLTFSSVAEFTGGMSEGEDFEFCAV